MMQLAPPLYSTDITSIAWLRAVSVFAAVAWLVAHTCIATAAPLPPEGTNVAPLAPYSLTPKPNADYAPEKTGRELTDGVRSFGRFWSNGLSVGWEKRSPIIFRQTYPTETPIKSVEIGTGKNARSMIALPSHALVYAAGDNGRFAFIGDARGEWKSDKTVADGVASLSLQFESVMVRHVVIVLFRDNSSFLFLDEVKILSFESGKSLNGTLAEDQITEHAVAWRRSQSFVRAGPGPLGSNPSERRAWPLTQSVALARTQRCSATRISPWVEGTAKEILNAPAVASIPSLHVPGGWLVAAFRIENNTQHEQIIDVEYASAEGVDAPKTSVVSYVLGLDYEWRADVVEKVDRVPLPAGSFALLLIEAPISKAGELRLGTTIECGHDRISVELTGRSIPIASQARPYGNLWSYLTGPVARTPSCWSSFHQDSGVNTAVVNETALNRRLNRNAEAFLRTYLRAFSNSTRLLLYMEMTDSTWLQSDSETELEAELSEWWSWVSNVIKQEKYSGEVVLYPIDEAKPGQVQRLNMIARVFRRIAPGIPLYGTVDDVSVLESADLDIMQVLERVVPSIPPHIVQQKELHLYSTRPLTKTLSVSNHYRRLSWTAFGASLRGSGFWSMWDASGISSPNTGWSDFGGSERDYAAVYGSPEGCVYPSRRLLAWRRGLEDFAVLEACRKQSQTDLRANVQTFVRREGQEPDRYDETLYDLVQGCID